MTAPAAPALSTNNHATFGNDVMGWYVLADGIIAPLTECCRASAKGSGNVASGVCCRACYAELDPMMGAAWLLSEPATLPAAVLAELVSLHVLEVTVA